jgi:hypothetical protein
MQPGIHLGPWQCYESLTFWCGTGSESCFFRQWLSMEGDGWKDGMMMEGSGSGFVQVMIDPDPRGPKTY